MKINTLKDLQQLIAVCHKQGIKSISVDGVQIELGDKPVKQKRNAATSDIIPVEGTYSDEDTLLWSATANG